jgi:type II secretory pathway pseudopilin PulG
MMLYPFSRLFPPARLRPFCAPAARKKRRGFNLIESAIVLGVVGLVIGGIWVAAASVKERLRQSETTRIVVTAIDRMRAVLRDVPAYTYADSYSLTDLAIASDAFPSNAQTPYGELRAEYETDYEGRSFSVKIYGISPEACIRILSVIAGGASSGNLDRVIVFPTYPGFFTSFPIPMDQLVSQCKITNGSITITSKY